MAFLSATKKAANGLPEYFPSFQSALSLADGTARYKKAYSDALTNRAKDLVAAPYVEPQPIYEPPWNPFVNLKASEAIPYLRANASWANTKALAASTFQRYHNEFVRTGDRRVVFHILGFLIFAGYLVARPTMKRHGEHGAYIREYH
eukprot:TRINITY_DN22641_c0_g1_i1.p2 TRINITY_DN22641_c0_g1~~TRINITY_DN22641_c0_g1_i1.p2  ORF type:complete len:147 (+),score=10.66 TRINITY_DN22641_c0_g1_i1:96-536(+)